MNSSLDGQMLRWKEVEGGDSYRVTFRENATGEYIAVIRDLVSPSCEIPFKVAANPSDFSVRVERHSAGTEPAGGKWQTLVPFSSPVPAPGALLYKAADDAPFTAFRTYVRSRDDQVAVLDTATCAREVRISDELRFRGDLEYKIMGFSPSSGKWENLTPYRIFTASKPVPAQPAASQPASPKRAVPKHRNWFAFTIDTEANLRHMAIPSFSEAVDQHIFGRSDGKIAGITKIMDLLDERNQKGTFFVDILMEYQFGQKALEDTIEAISSRGHDIQLHLHPTPHLFFKDEFFDTAMEYARTQTPASFRRAMDLAAPLFERRVGKPAVAFRNGSYVLREEFFPILKDYGIKVDSSLFAYKHCMVNDHYRARTTPFLTAEGILEIPVNWAIMRSASNTSATQYTLRVGRQNTLLQRATETAFSSFPGPLVMLIHSYTLLNEFRREGEGNWNAWNVALKEMFENRRLYEVFARNSGIKIDLVGEHHERISAMESRLDQIAANPNVQAITFEEIAKLDPHEFLTERNFEPLVEVNTKTNATRLSGITKYGPAALALADRKSI